MVLNEVQMLALPVRDVTGAAVAKGGSSAGIDAVLAERGSRYGEFDEHARITQAVKRALVSGRSWERMTDSQKEALEMVAHKMGRIVNGDPAYVDSWTDLIGYARLAERELLGERHAE